MSTEDRRTSEDTICPGRGAIALRRDLTGVTLGDFRSKNSWAGEEWVKSTWRRS